MAYRIKLELVSCVKTCSFNKVSDFKTCVKSKNSLDYNSSPCNCNFPQSGIIKMADDKEELHHKMQACREKRVTAQKETKTAVQAVPFTKCASGRKSLNLT